MVIGAQHSLYPSLTAEFPSTRYQGSKSKLADWIWEQIADLSFTTCLDAFGGTGAVAYRLKKAGKQVTYNDLLRFNYYIGLALIENSGTFLSPEEVDWMLERHADIDYSTFVQDTFSDIYFTDEENAWIDQAITNIRQFSDPYKFALAFFALCQACIIKRPYNLFHRKNLYVRLAEVERSFGNKTTWDRPYISNQGIGVDYRDFYHFLEGMTMYDEWGKYIDQRSKHLRLQPQKSEWTDRREIYFAFDRLFHKFADSYLVVSYRSDGIPSESELVKLLKKYKRSVRSEHYGQYKYVLSTNSESREILLIGT